ncbi:NAD(P)-binding protein [Pholiota conissans]|uniref:NAD(P)-binding protein n=1 Tax=Pholiota conissans TaxID=109636 RepID=A0A9P5YS27_9AGAR|nr:NAD(P)-binding protein [Pholiota conissans]
MPSITNGRVLFAAAPEGYPEPGKHIVYDTSKTLDLETVPLNGGILIKTLELSIDPYMRGQMREAHIPSYMPAFPMGEPIYSLGIGVVLRSEHSDIKAGDHVTGLIPHQQYSVLKVVPPLRKIENPHHLPWSFALGVLGMPGQTAFMGWNEYSRAKKGETVFVSAGAGAVGSLVIQLAKMDGCKVIGSAGSEEKVRFMKECGADIAFNYKTTNTLEVLKKEGPIDIYWDNVGGETFDAALDAAASNARFIVCGTISTYNDPKGTPIYNMPKVFEKCLSINGFLYQPLEPKWRQQFAATIPPLVAAGKIKHKEDVYEGLDKVGGVILALQKGANKGKAMVHVADEV